jgi:hypothetical protein
MKNIKRKILGALMLLHMIPLLCLFIWAIGGEWGKYKWYEPILGGYLIDCASLCLLGIVFFAIKGFQLIDQN